MKQDTGEGISPIETHYAGCRFRSRLEARWAVFFDTLGLKWEYEPQGFVVHSGPGYLPDFAVQTPACLLFVEVKPSRPEAIDPAGVRRWERFAEALMETVSPSQQAACMLIGPIPDPGSVRAFASDESGYESRGSRYSDGVYVPFDECYRWCACSTDSHFGIEFDGRGGRIDCECPGQGDGDGKGSAEIYTADSPRLLTAYRAARSARFEHGESP